MKRIALIGYGAITRIMMEKLAEHDPDGAVRVAGVLVRPAYADAARAALGARAQVVTDIEVLIRLTPNVIVECAGQGAVAQYGEAVLRAGIDLMVISTGALADDALRGRLIAAARATSCRLVLPAGAIAGIDGLNALRIGGLESVRYISAKPPGAWRGTPAETEHDLDAISRRTVLYTGPAMDAARLYPKNANLAATVALAGLGLQRTEIQLVADPSVAPYNVGRIEAKSRYGELVVESRGLPAPENPKTSATTALSLTHAILRDTGTLAL
jgi:aspartate dehydrogenase